MLTYSGHIFPVQLGATAVVGKPWSITVAAGLPRIRHRRAGACLAAGRPAAASRFIGQRAGSMS